MNHWESLVERKIREAMEQGEFDDLPGKGQPVDLSENPFEDPELRMAHRFLRNAGFAPAWIEERKDIDAELESARTLLARATRIYRQTTPVSDSARTAWQRRLGEFRDKVAELNRRIQAHNLQVPAAVFQRRQIDSEREIERVINGESD
jgi:DnaJ family protein C protein 28